jgi:hypothetical protein
MVNNYTMLTSSTNKLATETASGTRLIEVCRHLSRCDWEFAILSTQKPRFKAGSTQWRRPRRCSLLVAAFGDTLGDSIYVALL